MRRLLPVLLLFLPALSQAAHIIGGDFTYVCNGNGSYTFTLTVYRDCQGGGAPFDGASSAPFPATVTIYVGNSFVPFANLSLGAPQITEIDPDLSNPCLIVPPGVCVEQGVYTFNANLPVTDESYHIVYQRCCRNSTITNIIDPGNVGATYWLELTPFAQSVCNDSPKFNNFPPIVICAGEPLEFDFSATDPDGDELSYSFFNPFRGGGTNQTQPTQANGVAPDPDLPPPYALVNFINPPYTFLNPIGGNPQVAINPVTGLMTGTPELMGQFVAGVQVREERNGQLLSIVRREFQFNITTCEPTVIANILEDDVLPGGDFLVISCGENTVGFTNQSTLVQFINDYYWTFDLNGTEVVSEAWNAVIEFPGEGVYQGQLVLNEGTSCGDTADIEVRIFPEVVADFIFDYDTCLAGPVLFTDLSFSNAGPNALTDWAWAFGDGNGSDIPDPIHLYNQPGVFPVALTVTDVNDCSDTLIQELTYYPVPREIVVGPSEQIACQPAEILFDNLSSPIDSTYTIVWDFGDGQTSGEISPVHIFEEEGIFTVSISITSPIGCATDTVFPSIIQVLPSPIAGFTYSPENPTNFNPQVFFQDQSIDAVSWRYDFGGWGFAFEPNPDFVFPDTGLQVVTQVVTHPSGCRDTAVVVIDVVPLVTFFMPNAITPNGDGVNEVFRGTGFLEGMRDFRLTIWNRYGELVFESSDPVDSWNGRKDNVGPLVPAGVYVYLAEYLTPRGEPVTLKGYATVIR